LCDGGLAQRAKRDDCGEEFHFSPLFAGGTRQDIPSFYDF
jgi:hypothetical protein